MLIYEKNNKLNINFDPSKSIEGTPDIQIGENEIKLGDAEITSENVLPTPTNEDVGKVPTVQEDGTYSLENIPSELPVATPEDEGKVVSVDENGSYALANAGGGSEPFIVSFTGGYGNPTSDKTFTEVESALSEKLLVLGCDSGGSGEFSPTRNSLSFNVSSLIGPNGVTGYQFLFFSATSTNLKTIAYTIAPDDSVTAIVKTTALS